MPISNLLSSHHDKNIRELSTQLHKRHIQNSTAESQDDVNSIKTSVSTTHRVNETAYANMLRDEAQMEMRYNIAVSAANWALLAGYLVIPGTFTSLQNSSQIEETLSGNKAGQAVLNTIQNPPLLAIAFLFFVGAITGILLLL
ncbi:hypothetical protein N7478_010076 [Penicillium angulare]|uniref:uncharacterized protein n=1 Tax=Penicillium angulare TaxID=116970 RepID=UPI002540508F|nr:uncharacterized protein N7478_010076 [Penicillium angulare]KAJ5267268.1 hypothetical protein N7478_010076 [Penicillium angulare]